MAKPLRGRLVYAYSFDLKMQIKAVHVLFSLFLLLFSLNATQAQTSINNGSWNSAGTWSGNVVPTGSDNVSINNIVTIQAGTTAEVNDLTINETLVIYGTLIVYGSLFTGNNSELIANSGSNIFIFGDANLANRISIDLSSYFIVKGNFNKDGSQNQGNLTVTGAHIYIFGEVNVPQQGEEPWENFSLCSPGTYDGLTETENDDCDAGQLNDFVDIVKPEELPDGIYDQLVGCDAPNAIISGDATICESEFTTISVEFTGTGPWEITTQRNGGDDVTVTNIDVNPYTFNVSEAGVYTVSAVSDVNCSGTASGSATVVVNQFNMVVSDVTLTPSGEHCPEFGGPFNPDNSDYNAGVTEVIFKVIKEESATGTWTFDFGIDESGDVEVYDLVSVTGNNSIISYDGNVAGGSIDATDNTEVTFTFQIKNVPGTRLDVAFTVLNGNDGICIETGSIDDNNLRHIINVMPAVGSFSP